MDHECGADPFGAPMKRRAQPKPQKPAPPAVAPQGINLAVNFYQFATIRAALQLQNAISGELLQSFEDMRSRPIQQEVPGNPSPKPADKADPENSNG
jgi:hypothetical protein